MKIRLMGTQEELNVFQQTIKQIPGINILNQSKEYPNRGTSQESRIYIECNLIKTKTIHQTFNSKSKYIYTQEALFSMINA